jgi:hypothetical protein
MFFRIILAAIAATALLDACTPVKKAYSQDGKNAFTVDCTARGWDRCYIAAGKKCKQNGYEILERSSEERASSPSGSTSVANGATETSRTMVFACK